MIRPAPKMPAHMYRTYAVRSPLDTHWRSASCKEINCAAYKNGWDFKVEDLPPDMLYLATHSGKKFRRVRIAEGETYLFFEAGQPCFAAASHRIELGRPEFYFAGTGDHRLFSTRNATQHATPDDWVDDFANNVDKIITLTERG